MTSLFTDIGYYSLNKHGERICGDHACVVEPKDGSIVLVLADGLNSGVKASILSTLTARIISTMIANAMSLEECMTTVAATLPVCKVRQIAYSTFTIIKVFPSGKAEIIQYDNPHVIVLRNGKNLELPLSATEIDGKTIYRSKIHIRENDVFIAMTDGAVHAGVGKVFNFGWQREHIIKFMEQQYNESLAAKALTTILLHECNRLYNNEPGDDTTVCTMKFRARKPVHLLIGPPRRKEDDAAMLSLFFAKEGKHIVCGGTSAGIAARFLGRELKPSLDYVDPDVPPCGHIEGVDLVTEGIVTISKVLDYARSYLGDNMRFFDWNRRRDGASRIAQILFEEATDITFYVGRAVNPAHQNPDIPVAFTSKMQLIDDLANSLKLMGKRITVSHF